MATGILRVKGTQVVDNNDTPVILRGAAIGGWLNMENFITGFPGHESSIRAAMLAVMGKERYDFFFDRWLYYFFTEADARFFKSLGLNSIRIPFNYRHFEDDMNPRVLKESGFKHLDRVIDLCAQHGIYTILDMHTVPGGQSPGWHADNTTSYAAFWDYRDHQDRTAWLWEQLARRYKDNPWVAGFNPINEPCDPEHVRLPAFYVRLEKAIRAIDPHHILWLDGNTFAAEWKGFDEVVEALPNCVYSLHDYSMMGFPTGQPYMGTAEQKQKLEAQFLRKSAFQRSHHVPIWNGEFGPVYANPKWDQDAESVNQRRYDLLGEQLRIYDKHEIPWSIWLFKDIGLQGMVYTAPDSAWNKLVEPMREKKKRLQLDAWGMYPSKEVEDVIGPLVSWIDSVSPTAKDVYPTTWNTRRHIERAVLQTFLAETFVNEFAELFRDKDQTALEELAKSFAFDNCVQREGLNKIIAQYADLASKKRGA
ncbi:Beta-xylosidase [Exophiala dermatitidis]